jgi:parallel beta-helix repeat protein
LLLSKVGLLSTIALLCLASTAGAVTCPGNPATVAPTTSLQPLVTACPAGTTFILQAGTHHDNVTSLKTGDIFTSPSGTTADGVIEDGAVALPLSGQTWTQVTISGTVYWTTPGGTPLNSGSWSSTYCQTAYPSCWYTQDLYFNNVDYIHASSLASLTTGAWYYDFAGGDGGIVNNIYLIDNPTAATVELGAYLNAFISTTATNITVQGLTIEKYASNLQDGAVAPEVSGWIIQNNEMLLNHGSGIAIHPSGNNTQVLNNYLHDNGQFGVNAGAVSNITVSNNVIVHNNIDHTHIGFGAGCCKFTGTSSLVSYNLVHDNLGDGLWSDVFASGITYDHNIVYNNQGDGIRLEISDQQTVTNNVVYGNGLGSPDETGIKGWQINGVSSSHVVILNNHVTNTIGSLGGAEVTYNSGRGGCGAGCTIPVGTQVQGNFFTVLAGGPMITGVQDFSSTYSTWEIPGMWNYNTYCAPTIPWTGTTWVDGSSNSNVTYSSWQSTGQDLNSKTQSGTCSIAGTTLQGAVSMKGTIALQ